MSSTVVNVGIDLGVKSMHQAVGFDTEGQKITGLIKFNTTTADLDKLIDELGREKQLRFMMEPTAMAWMPVAQYLLAKGYQAFLVSAEKVHDLRKFYSKHAKNDRLDAETLARIPFICPDALSPPSIDDSEVNMLRRWVKMQDRLTHTIADCKRRILDLVGFAVPKLKIDSRTIFSPIGRQILKEYLSPHKVKNMGHKCFKEALMPFITQEQGEAFIDAVYEALSDADMLYGDDGVLDWEGLHEEIRINIELLEHNENALEQVGERIQVLYKSLHPSGNLETIYGVGKETAPVYVAALSGRQFKEKGFRSFCGVIPKTKQSGYSNQKEKMTKAGPPWLRRALYMSADTARKWDPQLARLYYQHRMRGAPHTKAICAVMARMADRILKIFEEDRYYELQDLEGRPISSSTAKQIIKERFTVSKNTMIRQRKWNRDLISA